MGMNDMVRFIREMTGKLGSDIYGGIQTQSNPQQISFLRQLQKEMKQTNILDCPLEKLNIVVFDLETTGFNPDKGDKIISIGAVKMVGSIINEEETFYSLVNPEIPLPEYISRLTNITEEQLAGAPSASEVLLDFYKFIGSSVLVAHHARHEQAFMKKLSSSLLRMNFDHRVIDTSFLIRLFQPAAPTLQLEEICNECGVEVSGRHHALSDSMMTAKVWSFYIEKAHEHGYTNLREIYEFLSRLR
ncbi:exonuclease domain-containing protein [Mesobacillus thioparans]|uniref:exonuclease domain-containing protein n=1 Tax=Mesobacillus thioparans TaxID=370439 RepID=UPI0039F0DD08